MKILVIGEPSQAAECKARIAGHELVEVRSHHEARPHLGQCSMVFDFIIDEDPSQLHYYSDCPIPVFLNSVKSSLKTLAGVKLPGVTIFGFNGLPTFFNRPVLEVTLLADVQREALASVCAQLDMPFEIAPDRPGMVTTRVVAMIINEAFSAMEDGTASASDIDIAMKLGTNYPYGPVEWGRKIGLQNVCDILDALYQETGNARYTVCNLLREESKRG